MRKLRTLGMLAFRRARNARHYVPFTVVGLLVTGLCLWLLLAYARNQVDYVVLAGAAGVLLVIILDLIVVLAASLRLRLHVRGRASDIPLRLQTLTTATTDFSLPRLRFWPLVSISVRWELPAGVRTELVPRRHQLDEHVTPSERGRAAVVTRRLVAEDIFGFVRLGVAFRCARPVRIAPAKLPVTAHVISRISPGDAISHPDGPAGGDLLEMRRYVQGDPLRYVLWRAYARTRTLLVRAPERATTPHPSAAAYLVAGAGDEATAGAARYFLEHGLLGTDFRFSADGADHSTSDPAMAVEQIIDSAAVRSDGGRGLAAFLGGLGQAQLGATVIFVPPLPGPWLARVIASRNLIREAKVLTAVDGNLELDRPRLLRRLLFTASGPSRKGWRDVGHVLKALSRAGYELHVVHRPTGDLLSRARLEDLIGVAS